MSKKMLKRSLALGALMAFVITGQAWAASGVVTEKEGFNSVASDVYEYKGNGNDIWDASSFAKTTTHLSVGANEKVTVSGFDSIVLDGIHTIGGDVTETNAICVNKGELIFSGIDTIKSADDADLDVGFHAINSGILDIYADNIKLDNFANALLAQAGGQLTVDVSGDISISSDKAYSMVYAGNFDPSDHTKVSTITLEADNDIIIKVPNGTGLCASSTVYLAGGVNYGKNGIVVEAGNKLEVVAKNAVVAKNGVEESDASVTIEATTVELNAIEKGVTADTNGKIEIDAAKTTITTNNGNGLSYGIDARYGSSVNVTGALDIDATSKDDYAAGVYSIRNSDITLGAADNKSDITIKATCVDGNGDQNSEWDNAYGVYAYSKTDDGNNNNSEINIFADELNITVDGAYAYGVFSGSNVTTGAVKSSVVIDANKTKITVTSDIDGNASALTAYSGSEIIVKGDLEATADNVILTRGNATVKINENAENTVNLTGDILFARANAESKAEIDANVLVNLVGEQSAFKGNILVEHGTVDEISGMKLSMSKGAKWELSEASVVNQVTFVDNAVLAIKDGSVFEAEKDSEGNATTGGVYALNAGGGDSNELTVAQGAKLQIGNIKETTYNIATGFEIYEAVKGWTEIADNNLMKAEMQATGTNLQAVVSAKDAGQIAEDMGVDSGTASALGSIIEAANKAGNVEGTPAANVVEFAEKIAEAPAEVAAAAAEAVIKMAEAGGNSATAASIVKNVTGVTNDRLSFNCGHSAPHKGGGHGVGLFEEGSGADIWAEYVHGKDKVEDMPSSAGASSYEGQYNGFVLGVDFKKVNKFQSGIAFNYGEGDTNTVGSAVRTRSDYDFWGVGYYGNIHNDDSNVIFDINYAQTDSEVTQKNLTGDIEASPETTTWSAGVKLEKLYQNENVQIVPYTGLRYMSIDPDDYATKCGTYKYSMDRQDIWLLPVGVSIRQEIANDNGWTVSPRVDLSYIWAFGDTDSNMEFATALNTKTNIGYDVMDDGSFLGLVGIEAHKGQWGYGVSYSYQKGDHSESKKWYVDVNYSF